MLASRLVVWIGAAALVVVAILSPLNARAEDGEDELVKQGTVAFKQGNRDLAIARYSEAINLNPNDADALSLRGEAYVQQGKFDQAISDCNRAVVLSPDSSEGYRRRGYVYDYKGDRGPALEDFDTAIKLDPRNASAYALRGETYREQGQTQKAIDDLNQSIKLDPSVSDVYVYRGNAWFTLRDYESAWDDFDRAIQIDPRNAFAYYSRGYSADKLYKFDAAIVDFDKALAIEPTMKLAAHYRADAEEGRNAIWWIKVYGIGFGVAIVALLFAAFRCYRSPSALRHVVELSFERTPGGRLIFYPGRVGYQVPDRSTEERLRAFSRHSAAGRLAFGVIGPILMGCSTVLAFPFISWIQRLGMPVGPAIWIVSSAVVVTIMAILLASSMIWRRSAVGGLSRMEEKRQRLRSGKLFDAYVADMPVAVRWVLFAVVVFFTFKAVSTLWRARSEFPISIFAQSDFFKWMSLSANLVGLYYLGWILILTFRSWRSPEVPSSSS